MRLNKYEHAFCTCERKKIKIYFLVFFTMSIRFLMVVSITNHHNEQDKIMKNDLVTNEKFRNLTKLNQIDGRSNTKACCKV